MAFSIRLSGCGHLLDWLWSSTRGSSVEGLSRRQYYFSPLSPSGAKKSLVELLETQETGKSRGVKMEDAKKG